MTSTGTLRLAALATGDDAPWCRAGVNARREHANAVDPDVADAGGDPVGGREGGTVGNRDRVKEHDVGETARMQEAAVVQAEALCHSAAHLADRLFQRQHALLADVLAQDARVGPVLARVRRAEGGGPGRIHATR